MKVRERNKDDLTGVDVIGRFAPIMMRKNFCHYCGAIIPEILNTEGYA